MNFPINIIFYGHISSISLTVFFIFLFRPISILFYSIFQLIQLSGHNYEVGTSSLNSMCFSIGAESLRLSKVWLRIIEFGLKTVFYVKICPFWSLGSSTKHLKNAHPTGAFMGSNDFQQGAYSILSYY